MEKECIPYAQALALKGLGFDEECLCLFRNIYKKEWSFTFPTGGYIQNWNKEGHFVSAPLYQQAFDWFMDNYQLYCEIEIDQTTAPKYCFKICQFIGNPKNLAEKEWEWKNHIPDIEEWGLYREYREARLACLRKLIKIVTDGKVQRVV